MKVCVPPGYIRDQVQAQATISTLAVTNRERNLVCVVWKTNEIHSNTQQYLIQVYWAAKLFFFLEDLFERQSREEKERHRETKHRFVCSFSQVMVTATVLALLNFLYNQYLGNRTIPPNFDSAVTAIMMPAESSNFGYCTLLKAYAQKSV